MKLFAIETAKTLGWTFGICFATKLALNLIENAAG